MNKGKKGMEQGMGERGKKSQGAAEASLQANAKHIAPRAISTLLTCKLTPGSLVFELLVLCESDPYVCIRALSGDHLSSTPRVECPGMGRYPFYFSSRSLPLLAIEAKKRK